MLLAALIGIGLVGVWRLIGDSNSPSFAFEMYALESYGDLGLHGQGCRIEVLGTHARWRGSFRGVPFEDVGVITTPLSLRRLNEAIKDAKSESARSTSLPLYVLEIYSDGKRLTSFEGDRQITAFVRAFTSDASARELIGRICNDMNANSTLGSLLLIGIGDTSTLNVMSADER